jgi:hypothetical protein
VIAGRRYLRHRCARVEGKREEGILKKLQLHSGAVLIAILVEDAYLAIMGSVYIRKVL